MQIRIKGVLRDTFKRSDPVEESQLRELILQKQIDGRITCQAAMEIAEQSGTPRMKIGKLLNEMKIKVHSCQLGCFK